jgi:hypothetical protein
MCVFCWDLLKDYVLKLMVSMCVFCWDFVEGLCAEIDGFNVCVLLELSDSVYVGVVTACVVCVHAKMCVEQRNCDSLPKLRRL